MKKILKVSKLGSQWEASDPFLLCIHHSDAYPKGNDDMSPGVPLTGRNIGNDFQGKDGWNMYHGEKIPGFPEHPHRGFETVTAVIEGYVDHADSTGATGRYGPGDVQWMTAGQGARHSEMFPLINKDKDNPLELFQIWLNLPRKDKFLKPHYKMLWAEDIPVIQVKDANDKKSTVRIISGSYQGKNSLEPSPGSWAKDKENHVSILMISMEPEAVLKLPKVSDTLNRTLYYYLGDTINIDETDIPFSHSIKLIGSEEIMVKNGTEESFILLLEGEPIGEPVVSRGPFVMTTRKELEEAFSDYYETGFGEWPWHREDMVHPRDKGRFAQYSDGTVENR